MNCLYISGLVQIYSVNWHTEKSVSKEGFNYRPRYMAANNFM